MIVVILAFAASLILGLIAVPILANFARRVGLVDLPDNRRKLHKSAIPLVGGLAVFVSVSIVTMLGLYFGVTQQELVTDLNHQLLGWLPIDFARRLIKVLDQDVYELFGLFLGSTLLVIVGVLDDRFGIRGRQKLFGQFLAVTVLILFGYHFDKVTILDITIDFNVFSILFVYAWVLAAINSVNLLDGADGIAATIGIVMSLALTVMAIYQGQMANAIISVCIAGALLGFLRYNFPPARVYLGDTGSMLIGFLLAAIAMRCTFKQNSAYAFFAPVALLAIPFIDTGAAIIRRRLTGRSIFAVDRGHLHHSLMKRGYSPQVSLLWVAVLCLTTATGAVLSLLFQHAEYALISIAMVVCVMIGCKIFGVAEFQLVSHKAGSLAKIFMNGKNRPVVQQSTIHVQGNRDWNSCWQKLNDFADEHNVVELVLDLNAPWLHESFHAKRKRADLANAEGSEWSSEIPLITGGRIFGRVEVTGLGDEQGSHRKTLASLLEVTSEIENHAILNDSTDSVYKLIHPEESVANDAPPTNSREQVENGLPPSDEPQNNSTPANPSEPIPDDPSGPADVSQTTAGK